MFLHLLTSTFVYIRSLRFFSTQGLKLMQYNIESIRCIIYRYNAVQYIMILHKVLQWLEQNINCTKNSWNTPHISLSRASYGVSFMRNMGKIDRVITASRCNWHSRVHYGNFRGNGTVPSWNCSALGITGRLRREFACDQRFRNVVFWCFICC